MTMSFMQRLVAFFGLTYLLSWTAFTVGIFQVGQVGSLAELRTVDGQLDLEAFFPYILAGSFGPFAAALIMILTSPRRWSELRSWLARFVRVRFHPFVYLLAAFSLPVVFAVILALLGIRPVKEESADLVYLTLLGISPFNGLMTAFLGAGPLGEEPGWRGWALPRLLRRAGEFPVSVVLGLVWTFWHLPLMLVLPEWRGGLSVTGYLPLYAIGVVSLAYILTKLWIWSRGSILLAIWFHGIVNFVAGYPVNRSIWQLDDYTDLELVLIVTFGFVLTAGLFAIVARLWRGGLTPSTHEHLVQSEESVAH